MIVYIYGLYNKIIPDKKIIKKHDNKIEIVNARYKKYLMKKFKYRKFRIDLFTIHEDYEYD